MEQIHTKRFWRYVAVTAILWLATTKLPPTSEHPPKISWKWMQMLLVVYKMGVHWYFWFCSKTGDNKNVFSKYKTLKQIVFQLFFVVHIIWQTGWRRIKYKPFNII